MNWHPLENVSNLYDGYRKTFHIAGHNLLLLQHEDKVFLVDNICPHAGYPMEKGKVIDGQLRCPMHGYLFDLQTGNCTEAYEGPCSGISVFKLEQRNDELGVLL